MEYDQEVETKWRSRKWILACASFVMLNVALFTGYIDGSLYITGLTLITGLYNGANALLKNREEKA